MSEFESSIIYLSYAIGIIGSVIGTSGALYGFVIRHKDKTRKKEIKQDIIKKYREYLLDRKKHLIMVKDIGGSRSYSDKISWAKFYLRLWHESNTIYSDQLMNEILLFRVHLDRNLFNKLENITRTIKGMYNPNHLDSNQNNIDDLIWKSWQENVQNTITEIDDMINTLSDK